MNIKIYTLFALLCTFFVGQSFDTHKLSKTESAQYNLKANGKLHIYNKYGYVNIKTWDKQETKIDVFIEVDAKNEKKAQEALDRITINFSESGSTVSAKTEIGDSDNNGWNYNYNMSFKINYDVMMPRNVYLDLFNKYGDSEVPDLDRDVKAEIKYGNITLGNVKGNVEFQLGYGGAHIGNVNDFSGYIKYSDFELKDAGNVNLETKYSKIVLGNVGDLTLESKYDNYRVASARDVRNNGKYDDFRFGEIQSIHVDSKYTDWKISKIHEHGKFYQRYGNIKIDELAAGASKILADLKYTDLTIDHFTGGYKLDFTGEYSNCNMAYGSDNLLKDKDGKDLSLRGTHGNGGTIFDINMEYANFKVRN